jgi:fumarate reductase subunit C
MAAGTKAKVRQYVRSMPANWWLARKAYTLFMVRELSSASLAGYAVFLLVLLSRVRTTGTEALAATLTSPVSIVLHLVVLCFALFNTITTFNLAPRVLALRQGEDRVPDTAVAGAHYAAWVLVSIVLIAVLMTVRP